MWQLAHAQGHFDLTHAFALRLRTRLAALAVEGDSEGDAERALWVEVERAYRDLSGEHAEAQRRCDRETNHGHREARQLQWVSRAREAV